MVVVAFLVFGAGSGQRLDFSEKPMLRGPARIPAMHGIRNSWRFLGGFASINVFDDNTPE